ncbi:MAG: kelch repeat-containing protein [Acidobacteriaceae bacterium]
MLFTFPLPGKRFGHACALADSKGNLWLLGGYGSDSVGALGYLNDLWEFQPEMARCFARCTIV